MPVSFPFEVKPLTLIGAILDFQLLPRASLYSGVKSSAKVPNSET